MAAGGRRNSSFGATGADSNFLGLPSRGGSPGLSTGAQGRLSVGKVCRSPAGGGPSCLNRVPLSPPGGTFGSSPPSRLKRGSRSPDGRWISRGGGAPSWRNRCWGGCCGGRSSLGAGVGGGRRSGCRSLPLSSLRPFLSSSVCAWARSAKSNVGVAKPAAATPAVNRTACRRLRREWLMEIPRVPGLGSALRPEGCSSTEVAGV